MTEPLTNRRPVLDRAAPLTLATAEDEHHIACLAECGHAARADKHRLAAAASEPAGRPA